MYCDAMLRRTNPIQRREYTRLLLANSLTLLSAYYVPVGQVRPAMG